MILNVLLLVLGFALLIKGADFLVLGASGLARRFNISELIIGLTIVAFGTSMPELVVSSVSALKGLNDVALGNIIGSNLVNLLFILGLTAVISPVLVQRSTIFKEIPYSIIAAIVLLLLANDHLYTQNRENIVGRIDAIILLAFFGLFLIYTFKNMRQDDQEIKVDFKPMGIWIIVLHISLGLAGLIFGGSLSVNNAVDIAHTLGISERIIGLTVVAVGTSLPELATSAVAAYRKNSDIAVGNIVGSNIFNIFLILGVSAFINPLPYHLSFNFDLTFLIAGTFLLLFFTYIGKKAVLGRWEGATLVACYIAFTLFLIFTPS